MIPYEDRLNQAVDYLVIVLRIRAPKETWNLTYNGIRKTWNPTAMTWEIVIGGEPAPYAVFTNEPWVADRWGGATNPNQGWIQEACEEARPTLIAIMSGAITQEDYAKLVCGLNDQFQQMSIEASVNVR